MIRLLKLLIVMTFAMLCSVFIACSERIENKLDLSQKQQNRISSDHAHAASSLDVNRQEIREAVYNAIDITLKTKTSLPKIDDC